MTEHRLGEKPGTVTVDREKIRESTLKAVEEITLSIVDEIIEKFWKLVQDARFGDKQTVKNKLHEFAKHQLNVKTAGRGWGVK